MSEDVVYVNTRPDHLTTKVGRGQGEMEQREERIEDIYLIPDDQDPVYIYATSGDLNPGSQQDAAQSNTAHEEQHGGGEESKQNRYMEVAVEVCVGLSCLLLLTGIIVLLIQYCASITRGNNLQHSFEDLLTRLNNMTELKNQYKTSLGELQTTNNNLIEQRDQCKTRMNNLTEQRDQCETSFDELRTRHTNLMERDDIKKTICESLGFTHGGGVCYYISTEEKPCEESRTYCRDNQSDLIIITSQEKQDWLTGLVDTIVGRDQGVWLGLTDRDKEGVWKWVDGRPLTAPTYWQPGEPNDYLPVGGEDCAVFINGEWDDRKCSVNFRWICEKVI